MLATILMMAEGHPSVATGTDGVWFAWSERPDTEIFRAYHLPRD